MTAPRRISESELHAFVDGELTAGARAEIEAAAGGASRRTRRWCARSATSTRRCGPATPTVSRSRVPQAMLAAAGTHAALAVGASRRGSATLAAALLIAVAAGLAGYFVRGFVRDPAPAGAVVRRQRPRRPQRLLPEVRHPVEVKAAEEHLIRWLTRRVGAPIRAPSLADRGWKLMGGRLLPDLGLPAAQFMYEDAGGRRLTLYIRKETGLDNTAFRFYERTGFGAFYWIDRPLAYALAGRARRARS